jgi:hypothetical protein
MTNTTIGDINLRRLFLQLFFQCLKVLNLPLMLLHHAFTIVVAIIICLFKLLLNQFFQTLYLEAWIIGISFAPLSRTYLDQLLQELSYVQNVLLSLD